MVAHACNPSYLGDWGRRITWNGGVEVAVSWDGTIVLQHGQQERNFVSKQTKPQHFEQAFHVNKKDMQIANKFSKEAGYSGSHL